MIKSKSNPELLAEFSRLDSLLLSLVTDWLRATGLESERVSERYKATQAEALAVLKELKSRGISREEIRQHKAVREA